MSDINIFDLDICVIPLSQGKFTVVDPEDYEKIVAMGRWHLNEGYACRNIYLGAAGHGKAKYQRVWMHRVINETPDEFDTDHINGNKLDNRRCNLRTVTNTQNHLNVGPRATNTSGAKGVSWYKTGKKWRVQIRIDGKIKHVGYFDEIKDAEEAYRKAAIEHYGEYANF